MGLKRNKLGRLIEDLRVISREPPWDHLEQLIRLVDTMDASPELEKLSNDELRGFKGFRITLYRCRDMETDTMLKHVAAHWLGTVEQAIRKLPIGPEAVQHVGALLSFPSDQIPAGIAPY
jgi:hypothetical protein